MNCEHLKTISEDKSCKSKGEFTLWLTALYFRLKNGKNGTNLLDKNRVDKTTSSEFFKPNECQEVDEWISQWTALTPPTHPAC